MEFKRFFYNELKSRIEKELNFIQVLLGPRQVGKSTSLKQLMDEWPHSKLYVTADSVAPPDSRWIEFQWRKARTLKPPTLFIIDEVQKIEKWSEVVKTLFDEDRKHKKLRVILSGSASLNLQQGLQESLAGRFELIRAPHWRFTESEELFNWDIDTYLKYGGYPSASEIINDTLRWQAFIQDSIIEPVLGRDLQTLVTIQKPALLRQLFEMCMTLPAHEISYQKLLGQLQDKGNATTIKHYIEILEGAFLLKKLDKFSTSKIKQKSSSPKIIPLAPALSHAFINPEKFSNDPSWRGRIFEAAIGALLCQNYRNVYYWRDGDDEVDYVIEIDKQIYAIEIKSGRKKSLNGIYSFSKRFPKSKSILLTWESGLEFLKSERLDL